MTHDHRRNLRIYELVFHQYSGLLVRCRKPSYRGMGLLLRAERVLGVRLEGAHLAGVDRVEAFDDAVEAFAEALVGWDLLADGVPVPASWDGLVAQDHRFVVDLVRTWHRRVVLLVNEPAPEPPAPPTQPPAESEPARSTTNATEDEDLLANLPVTDLPAELLEEQPAGLPVEEAEPAEVGVP